MLSLYLLGEFVFKGCVLYLLGEFVFKGCVSIYWVSLYLFGSSVLKGKLYLLCTFFFITLAVYIE